MWVHTYKYMCIVRTCTQTYAHEKHQRAHAENPSGRSDQLLVMFAEFHKKLKINLTHQSFESNQEFMNETGHHSFAAGRIASSSRHVPPFRGEQLASTRFHSTAKQVLPKVSRSLKSKRLGASAMLLSLATLAYQDLVPAVNSASMIFPPLSEQSLSHRFP